jgi:chloramphenicol O-acetyltransferase type A
MKKINLETYKRRALFEAFKDRDIPFFSTTAQVDITHLKPFVNEHRYGFFVSLSFLISKSVNLVPELRHRIIDGELFEFERVDPGYTVLLDDRTFSFCDSRHFDGFEEYRRHANARITAIRECPDHGTGEKHHMFFITSLPWFSFTSITHPYDKKYGSIPVIAIGKYLEQNGRLVVPIGIQVHHGLVDGIHVGEFYAHLSDMCRTPAHWLR